jgi:hypothetical protein
MPRSANPKTQRRRRAQKRFCARSTSIQNGTAMTHTKTAQIRALNDDFRKTLTGPAVITPGIAALGKEKVERIFKAISVFDDFCHANDPHQEHDFGSVELDGETIFFKIDYYDRSLMFHSPDPADPDVTERVITIMLAAEY